MQPRDAGSSSGSLARASAAAPGLYGPTRSAARERGTLVIAGDAEPVPVLWAALDAETLDDAQRALAAREGIPPGYIERSVGAWSAQLSSGHRDARAIREWADEAGVKGVVWTALKPKFAGKPFKPSSDQVVRYLASLECETRRLAEEYVRRAPAQIRTAYRAKIERELGWTAATHRDR